MANILIVDDFAASRDLLGAILATRGHHLLQAADGAEALAAARDGHPDLVITDVLMPTMDGYEFVRQLRLDPDVGATPVVFYTAYYLESEAQRLAQSCGVSHILTKRSDPETVLGTVDAVLADAKLGPTAVQLEFDRDHLRLVTDMLSDTARKLSMTNSRLEALVEIGLQLATERDPVALLDASCRAARDLLGARYGVLGVWEPNLPGGSHVVTCGLLESLATPLRRDLDRERLFPGAGQRPYRALNPGGDPTVFGLPASHPRIEAILAAPLSSLERTYGWLYVSEKVGGQPFDDDDERLLGILTGQVGRIYENGCLLKETQRHAEELAGHIQQRQQVEAQLLQSQKMEAIGQLAGGVAHDFNNLLTAILGYAERLVPALQGTPRLRDVEQIRKSATRAAHLTRQLLLFSRRQILQPRIVDLNAVIADLATMLRRLLSEDVTLKLTLEPTLARITADPGQIEQVIMNLVVNARDAMVRGGTIVIETSTLQADDQFLEYVGMLGPGPQSLVRLAVIDSGVGIDAATMKRIFEPFFTTKPRGQGTGLGLATVLGIVQHHHGVVKVASEPERGSVFQVFLPATDEPIVSESVEATPDANLTGTEWVLLVEDEESVRTLVRTILEGRGFHVLDARNAEEALRILPAELDSIDLLLTDVVMPGLSGPELFERLVRERPALKVLYLSGYSDDTIVTRGLFAPDSPFLQKPFTARGLMRKIRDVLDADPAR